MSTLGKRLGWAASFLGALGTGFLAGNNRLDHDHNIELAREREVREHQEQRFRDAAGTVAERARRVQEAYDSGDTSTIGIPISELSSAARRMQHLPEELAQK